jgi:hypothetical protein
MREKIKVVEGYIAHIQEVEGECECAICNAQECGTYLDGLQQALSILISKK